MLLRLKIHGRVQAVCLRSQTSKRASELQLSGWVKNLSDGTVEILAQGAKDDLAELLNWIKLSPGRSQVSKIEEEWTDREKDIKGFAVKY